MNQYLELVDQIGKILARGEEQLLYQSSPMSEPHPPLLPHLEHRVECQRGLGSGTEAGAGIGTVTVVGRDSPAATTVMLVGCTMGPTSDL